MNWPKRTMIIIAGAAIAATVCLGVYAAHTRLTAVSRCVFNFDNRLSATVCDQVAHAIEQEVFSGKSLHDVAEHVTQTFACVDSMSVHRCAPGVMYCDIVSVHPLVHINNSCVVSDSGSVLSPDLFSPALLTTLRTIQVDNESIATHMPHDFIVAVKELVPSLLDTYDAQWIDSKKIVLQEKQAPHFSVICSADRLPNKQLLAYCQQLKDEMASCQTSSNKKTAKMHQWSADIRFEHQIVLGGVAHG